MKETHLSEKFESTLCDTLRERLVQLDPLWIKPHWELDPVNKLTFECD